MKQWSHQKPDERYTVQIARGGKPIADIEPDRISVVEEDVMYWRKANHIHGWFVDNVQSGKDDCGTYRVDDDKLRELLKVCREVLQHSKLVVGSVYTGTLYNQEHPEGIAMREGGRIIEDASVAKRLLPTREGFFFGCYEYDEDYWNEVERTKDWAALMLVNSKAGVPGEIYYHSSW